MFHFGAYSNFLDWFLPLLTGGGIVKVVELIVFRKQRELANKKTYFETDGIVSDNWEKICSRLEKQVERQALEIGRLQLENIELKEDLIKLRHLANFRDDKTNLN